MHAHVLQHVAFETPGYIETWLRQNGWTITTTRLWHNEILPSLSEFDLLIIMGGPMGVYDVETYPWLTTEKEFIAKAVTSKKKVVGICLGAQLLASALGADVKPNAIKEIGWFPVQLNASFAEWLGTDTPSSFTAFHWHGDRFGIPSNAVNHAHSVACDHQLFTLNDHVIAIQFHFEATPETVRSMVENCRHELQPDTGIQSENEIMSQHSFYVQSHKLLDQILKKITASATVTA